MSQLLNNKVALITGGASGIGLETVKLFLSEGAKVMIADINSEQGQAVACELSALGEVAFVENNVSNEESCRNAVEQTTQRFGKLDIAINNAGVIGETKPLDEISAEGWQRTMDININGVFFGLKYQTKAMMNSGGSIVNLASIAAKIAMPSSSDYITSKHAVDGLTKAAALDYADKGIRINCVGPALIETPLLATIGDNPGAQEAKAKSIMAHPIGRLGQAEEVANLILWLASGKASFCTGSYYPVNGGYLAQ